MSKNPNSSAQEQKPSAAKRIALLAAKNERIFHTKDLANLWLITNKNTLYTLLKRYTRLGLLHRIYKGFYSLVPLQEIDPVLIGSKALHQYCYLSTETILYREGYISQKVGFYSFISHKSGKFNVGDSFYKSRQLLDQYLFQTDGIIDVDGYKIATAPRAIADMLYFNSRFHFDKTVNWNEIKSLQQKIGYPFTPHRYKS
jgi:predicted transcriptional regulator of viral defense system